MNTLRLLVVMSLLTPQTVAGQSWKDWDNLRVLRPGATLKIKL